MSEVRTPPRRLVDLNPRWGGYYGYPDREGAALTFDCPCASSTCEWGGSIFVAIANPIDGGPPIPENPPRPQWTRTGDTFETLALSPSIHAVGHWHGWVKDGMVTSC